MNKAFLYARLRTYEKIILTTELIEIKLLSGYWSFSSVNVKKA